MGKEQKAAMAREIERHHREEARKKARREKLTREATIGAVLVTSVFIVMFMFMYIIDMRQHRFPDLGNCPMPKGTWLYQKWTNTIWAECK